jgi:hypothetical protein
MFNNFFKFSHFALGDLCILPRLNSSICAGKVLGSRHHYCYLVYIHSSIFILFPFHQASNILLH